MIAALAGGAALADPAWDAFETRCLTPMADFALAAPEDLTRLKSFKNDGNGYSTYAGPTGAFEIHVTDGLDAEGRSSRFNAMCLVAVEGGGAETANAFLLWSSQPEAFEMWEEIEGDDSALVLRSTTWREPKMEVSLRMGDGWVRLIAKETEFES